MDSIELFAGAGGLALGTANAGFHHRAVIEIDRNSCDTIRENQRRKLAAVRDWNLCEQDVTKFDFSVYSGIDLLSGGPPCQPFSIGGKAKGHVDRRNLFPEVVRAVRETQPKAILVENVKGILRPKFSRYLEYIRLQLTYPTVLQRENEHWEAHFERLEKHHTRGRITGLTYQMVVECLNAANFGVPQRRERVFFVGFRSDLGVSWSYPRATHSQDSLIYDQWVTGEYWDRHKVSRRSRPKPTVVHAKRAQMLNSADTSPGVLPWRTVRDAICDLPDPRLVSSNDVLNHIHNPGAKAYAGHTGSPLDWTAKTLKAGDHGVPGGENMLAYPNGDVRYFTVRESARLQTFPDQFVFSGSWTETMRQLGNAVPVLVAQLLASSIKERLTLQMNNGKSKVGRARSANPA